MLKKLIFFSILAIGIFIAFSSIFAMEIDWPPSPFFNTDLTDSSTLTDLTKYLYEWGIALGGLAAFVALLIAGFLYLTSVGDANKMADARGRIVLALFGLVLLLAAWLILNTINPDLTVLRMPPTDIEDIPNLLCDDPCADHNGNKSACKADIANNCAWKNFGPGYCYYNKTTNCKTHADEASCKGDSDCVWNSTYKYCYNKIGCEKGFVCVNDPDPGDGNKKGMCTSPALNDKPVCEYARVWRDRNFTIPSIIAEFDESTEIPGNTDNYPDATAPGSVKAFFDDSDLEDCLPNGNESITCKKCSPLAEAACKSNSACDWNEDEGSCYQDCGKDGCGCRLELYDDYNNLFHCYDEIAPTIPAYSDNLEFFFEETGTIYPGDGRPGCVILKKP